MALENVLNCPVCGGTQFKAFLLCQDYTTSQEKFNLCRCSDCDFVVTNPRPDSDSIGTYYKSDSYISHTGAKKGFLNRLYLLARTYTLDWKVKILKQHKHNGSVLDYGCGTGEFLDQCRQNGFTVIGVEPDNVARAKAEKLSGVSIHRDLADVMDKKFDLITLWHVLEHVGNLKEKLSQLKSLLTDTGIIFIAVPNHESFDAAFYQECWAGYDVPRHLWHFSKKDMTRLLLDLNLTVVDIKPMKLDALYVSLLSENYKNKQKNTMRKFADGILNGMKSNRLAKKDMNYSSLIYIARP